MLSNSGAGQALLGNKQSSRSQPKFQPVSDQIQPSKQSQTKSLKESASKTTKSRKKKSKTQKNFTFVLKVFNFLLGLLLTAFGAYCYYGINNRQIKSFQLIGYIMPGYIALSGLIILAIQMHIGIICRNMRFLYNYFGRGIFNIYVGVMPLTLLDNTQGNKQNDIEKVGIYILVSLLVFIGLLYIFAKVFCCAQQGDKRKNKRKRNSSDSSSSQSDD